MNIDIINPHELSSDAQELLRQIFSGEKDWLFEHDKCVLRNDRYAIIQKLNALFSKQISFLLAGDPCSDSLGLFWGLRIARFLNASETFMWVEKLSRLGIEDLENALGDCFVTEELPYLFADTMDRWTLLKDVIENIEVDEFIRAACLDSLVLAVAKKRIERREIINYFSSLFNKILNGEFNDTLFAAHLICACADIWPGECLEEIRELYGMSLVDESYVGIDCVLEDVSKGKDACLEKLERRLKQNNFWEVLEPNQEASIEEDSKKLNQMLKIINLADDCTKQALKDPSKGSQRNEVCGCGSGRKYKKCCMNASSLDNGSSTRIETFDISFEPLEDTDVLQTIPVEDRQGILDLYHLTKSNPERVIYKAQEFISKYPDIPMLYNYLYGAYHNTGDTRKAVKLLKETINLFPKYLFGRLAYAQYLLRRAEPEKALAVLENATTLSQLYPERKTFHVSEVVGFSFVVGLYWIQKDNINQAKIYFHLIKQLNPESPEAKFLHQKMKTKLFLQSLAKINHNPQFHTQER